MTQDELESMCLDIVIDLNDFHLKNGLGASDWSLYQVKEDYIFSITICYEYQNKKGYDELFIINQQISKDVTRKDYDDLYGDIAAILKEKLIRYFKV